jgi:hypothetical protein
MPLNKSWHDYNESLIERGRLLIDVYFLKSSNKEIKKTHDDMTTSTAEDDGDGPTMLQPILLT